MATDLTAELTAIEHALVRAWMERDEKAVEGVNAMRGGGVFFIAIGQLDDRPAVLGFSSHRVDDAQDGTSVYVRGSAARQGIGTALLQLAEAHALAHGATVVQIQASLAGVDFYKVNGYEELGRGDAYLMSGHSMPCVFMRKELT